jgi:hypothetical protein
MILPLGEGGSSIVVYEFDHIVSHERKGQEGRSRWQYGGGNPRRTLGPGTWKCLTPVCRARQSPDESISCRNQPANIRLTTVVAKPDAIDPLGPIRRDDFEVIWSSERAGCRWRVQEPTPATALDRGRFRAAPSQGQRKKRRPGLDGANHIGCVESSMTHRAVGARPSAGVLVRLSNVAWKSETRCDAWAYLDSLGS